ncbi:MAG TPA: flagellar filament capping protein FliD [Terracidiphilus sp.]|nr:flagellar filament capping protein FliD [Terracidiphilus sp.]
MGTVGLNFGSPTSGAGFDVSATVSQIMANLENVETPWKTQLSALESQDTVISNLGTLLSNLSNDVSQLTDFTGIMAQKTGSSSDTGVLQLTSASSAAVAGTHSVVVQSLAQTSSGYLTEVPSASTVLAGSITLQVGSGATQTITLNSSNNTLAGLAAAINSSGVGISASVLTDATGSRLSLVSGTSGANGNIAITGNSLTANVSGMSTPLSYTPAVAGTNASLTVDGVSLSSASNTVTGLIPGLTFQLLAPSQTGGGGSLVPVQVIIGNDNTGVESVVNQMVNDYNSLIKAMNTQQGNDASGHPEPLFGSPTLSMLQQQLFSSLNLQNPNGYLAPITVNASTALAGSITIQVGGGAPQTVNVPGGDTSLQGMVNAINAANIGVSAGISTKYGQSTLSLMSRTAGATGALAVTSNLSATTQEALVWAGMPGSGSSNSQGVLAQIPNGSDVLAGSISIQAGNGTAQTITLDASNNTLQGLADTINGTAGLGVTATVTTNGDGSAYLTLVSQTAGSAGNLTVTSNLLDTANATTTNMAYTNSSDISTLANLGITVSQSDNGTLTFDANTLDAALNSDFSGVVGFFQNVNSWGQSFATVLNNAGTSSSIGMLKLAQNANSSSESTLNAEISKEESMISAQQKKLTAELTRANEIMQALPTQLQGMDELYSAISGYNQRRG